MCFYLCQLHYCGVAIHSYQTALLTTVLCINNVTWKKIKVGHCDELETCACFKGWKNTIILKHFIMLWDIVKEKHWCGPLNLKQLHSLGTECMVNIPFLYWNFKLSTDQALRGTPPIN